MQSHRAPSGTPQPAVHPAPLRTPFRVRARGPAAAHGAAVALLLAMLAGSAWAGSAWAGNAWAGQRQVRFDVLPDAICRDATPEAFAQAHPDQRIWETHLEVSTLLAESLGGRDVQFHYEIHSPHREIQFVDYGPKTQTHSEIAGEIAVERKVERTHQIGGALTGALPYLAKATGSADHSRRTTDSVRFELRPEHTTVLASGTLARGSGVYFKLRPTRDSTLEGSRRFTLVFRTPRAWRGGSLHLYCRGLAHRPAAAKGFGGNLHSSRAPVELGQQRFVIALYAAGDAEAHQRAAAYASSERTLRYRSHQLRREISRRSLPTVAHELGALFSVVDPRIPSDWLDQELFQPPGTRGPSTYHQQLPAELRGALADYQEAKRALYQLSRAR